MQFGKVLHKSSPDTVSNPENNGHTNPNCVSEEEGDVVASLDKLESEVHAVSSLVFVILIYFYSSIFLLNCVEIA